MALEYGYFDSEITGYDDEGMPEFDRAKSSDFMADFFSKLITSGVLASPSTCFQVTAYDGMTVAIAPGYAFVEGRFAYDEDTVYLTLEGAPTVSSQSRIDMIVLRNNYADRLCEIVVKTGTAAASPAEPELVHSSDYYELCLAKIAVSGNQTVISQSNIMDTRYNTAYCGPVTQLIDSVDTSTLFSQYEASMAERLASVETWLESIKDVLSDDVAANLQLEIEALQAEDRDATYGSLDVTGNAKVGGALTIHEIVDANYSSETYTSFDGDVITSGTVYVVKKLGWCNVVGVLTMSDAPSSWTEILDSTAIPAPQNGYGRYATVPYWSSTYTQPLRVRISASGGMDIALGSSGVQYLFSLTYPIE